MHENIRINVTNLKNRQEKCIYLLATPLENIFYKSSKLLLKILKLLYSHYLYNLII